MPSIFMFYGVVVYMYIADHSPPRFHAKYQGHEAVYGLDGSPISGSLPVKQRKPVCAWATLHEEELVANWRLAEEMKELYPIDPLR